MTSSPRSTGFPWPQWKTSKSICRENRQDTWRPSICSGAAPLCVFRFKPLPAPDSSSARSMRLHCCLTTVGLLVCWLAAEPRVFAQDADRQFEAFFQSYLEQYFLLQPLEATRLGDHRFDHLT